MKTLLASFFCRKYSTLILEVATFLVIDFCVLVFSFYMSFQISTDATLINLAGRERMLSQSILVSLLELRRAEASDGTDHLADLGSDVALFDQSFKALQFGGAITDGKGRMVQIVAHDLHSADALEIMRKIDGIWQPYHVAIRAVLASRAGDRDALNTAIVMAHDNKLQFLGLLNDLTSYMENDATAKATHLRRIQMAGFALALINFVVIIFSGAYQIRKRDEAIQRTQAEMEGLLATSNAVLNNVDEGIIAIDEWGSIQIFNPVAERVFGYERSEIIGQNIKLLMPEPHRSQHDTYLESYLKTGKQAVIGSIREVAGVRKNGESFPLELTASEVWLDSKRLYIASARDISARKQAEADAQALRDQLNQAVKMESIGHLTAGIAHDFNNILGSMLGYAELAQTMLANKENIPVDALIRYLGRIHTSGIRAKELIAQMLAFSRLAPEMAEGEGEDTPVILLAPIVKEVVSLLRASIPSTIDLNYRIEDDRLWSRIQAVHLHQIILNLGINARDAIGEYGKIEVALAREKDLNQVCSSCQQSFTGEYIRLTVSDSGSGIPKHKLNKIFDPFYTTKAVGKGTGMGLSVVHGLVHAMNGHIQVSTVEGEGSAISILLPLMENNPDFAGETAAPERSDTQLHNIRIMVVDDERAMVSMLHEFLSMHGAEVASFNAPWAALESFEMNPEIFDLVITDETMPGLSGMHLAERMLKIKPDLPIILCTGYSEQATPQAAGDAGLAAFFYKPLVMNELLKKIQAVMEK